MAEINGVRPSVIDEGGEMQGELYIFLDASSGPGVCVWVGGVSNMDVVEHEELQNARSNTHENARPNVTQD